MRAAAFFGSVYLALVSVCGGQTTLPQYLNLTGQQIGALHQFNSDYQAYSDAEQVQINQANEQIQKIYAAGAPDPAQLGSLYLQLELIRRDMLAHITALQQQSVAQLSGAQMAQIAALGADLGLQPLASEAQCAYLLDAPMYSLADFLLGVPNYFFDIPAGRPNLVGPFIPTAPTAVFCGSTIFPEPVRLYLNLNNAQVNTISSASATYSDQQLRAQNQTADLQALIRNLTAAQSLDSNAIGAAYAQLAAVSKQVTDEGVQLQQIARATLTTQQTALLQTLQNAVTLQPLITQAEACSLLVPVPGNGANNFVFLYGLCLL